MMLWSRLSYLMLLHSPHLLCITDHKLNIHFHHGQQYNEMRIDEKHQQPPHSPVLNFQKKEKKAEESARGGMTAWI
jgi:hypothetical protein